MNEERENTKNPPEEDWAMNAPPTQQDGWKMPEPVFRISDGTRIGNSENEKPPSNLPSEMPQTAQPPSQNTQAEKAAPDAKIQPQPYISEEFNLNQIKAATAPVKSKSKIPRIIFIILGILAMVGFAVGFVIMVYYLFFYQPEI